MTRLSCRRSGRGAFVSSRGHLSWLVTIRQYLGKANLRKLEQSCFGRFLFVPNIQFQGQLYNALLRNLDRRSLRDLCLCFHINGRIAVFGPNEFGLITGLKFSEWFEPPTESVFHELVFQGSDDLVFDDIHKAFVHECQSLGGETENALKLALLYILYGILLIKDRKWKKIDTRYLHLVDDLSKFNEFPWGLVAYEFLVKATHRARDILENMIAERKTLAFDANGFTIAIQIWVYEVMPNVSSECAKVVSGMVDRVPRMIRWSACKYIRFDRINMLLSEAHPSHFPVSMKPSDIEKSMLDDIGLHWDNEGLTGTDTDLHLDKKTRFVFCECCEAVNALPGGVAGGLSHYWSKEHKTTISVERLWSRVSSFENRLHKSRASSDGVDECPNSPTGDPSLGVRDYYCTHADGGVPGTTSASSLIIPEKQVSAGVQSCSKEKSMGYEIGSQEMVAILQRDPSERSIDVSRVRAFESWRDNVERQQALMLPSSIAADADWFEPIWNRNGLILYDHIEALLHLLFVELMDSNNITHAWAPVDLFCWDALMSPRGFSRLAYKLMPYVRGEYPRHASRSWQSASHLYGVGHICCHWIAYDVSLRERRITVYDSMFDLNLWEEFACQFQILGRNVETLLALDDVDCSQYLPDLVNPDWDVMCSPEAPPCANKPDCGIMAIKYVECLITRADMSNLDPGRCGTYRRNYCGRLLKMSVIMGNSPMSVS